MDLQLDCANYGANFCLNLFLIILLYVIIGIIPKFYFGKSIMNNKDIDLENDDYVRQITRYII